MSMEHYIERPAVLPPDRFAAWVQDVRAVIETLPPSMICGEYGEGDPVLTNELVAFNGNAHYAVFYNEEAIAIYHNPARLAAYPASDEWHGDRVQPFHVARVFDQDFRRENAQGWLWSGFNTHGYAYDYAVVAALILFADRFAGMCKVSSDYSAKDWREGFALAEQATGRRLTMPYRDFYGYEWFRPEHFAPAPFAAWSADVGKLIALSDGTLTGIDMPDPEATPERVAFRSATDPSTGRFVIARDYKGWTMRTPQGLLLGGCDVYSEIDATYRTYVETALILLLHHFPHRMAFIGPLLPEETVSVMIKPDETPWGAGLALASEIVGADLSSASPVT